MAGSPSRSTSINTMLESKWKPEEWEKFRAKLETLSLDQLRNLATRVGMKFSGGNENVSDRKQMTAREQFIMVLDEVDREKLQAEYDKIIKDHQMN